MNKKQTTIFNDSRLMDLAEYEVTKGGLALRTPDEHYRSDVFARFRYFKMMVKRGSFTLNQLEDSVFERYGVVERSEILDGLADLRSLTEEMRKKVNSGKENKVNNESKESKESNENKEKKHE